MPKKKPGSDGPGQVGRRPSNPAILALAGLMWVGAGIYALAKLTASWKLVPGVVFIGIGLLFLRGWAATVLRRENRRK